MEVNIRDYFNVFNAIDKEWMLVGATNKEGKSNAMTASWGGLGILWNKNVAYVFVRPQRFTKKFIDDQDYLSLSFFDETYRKELVFMGRNSGKDVDKIKACNFDLEEGYVAPKFKQAKMTLICKKLYQQTLEEGCFIDKDLIDKNYPTKDYHDMYVVEIEKVIID